MIHGGGPVIAGGVDPATGDRPVFEVVEGGSVKIFSAAHVPSGLRSGKWTMASLVRRR